MEFAEIELATDRLTATGVAIGTVPLEYRLDYVETGADFVTSKLCLQTRGERWRRRLELRRSEAGAWMLQREQEGEVELPASGGDPDSLVGALDCDLGLSPVTNLMPILRGEILSGGDPLEPTAAWLAVPELSVQPDGQRYSHLATNGDRHVVRYEATDGSFAADITVDRDGLVIDYPGIARRAVGGVAAGP
jgi:hypothetical protein